MTRTTEWTSAAKVEATIRAPIGAHLLRPDSTVIERPGWYQLITPSFPHGAQNEIVLSELEEADVERVIDETIATYRTLGIVSIKWCVGPWSKPDDLGDRLARRGFEHWLVRGMAADPHALEFRGPSEIEVERVSDDTLPSYVDASLRGWQLPATETDVFAAICRERMQRGISELFVAKLGDEIVGSAAFVAKPDGSAYLVGAQVFDAHRRRGAYRALLAARLARLRARGIGLATTHAREQTSAPILERLGFETMFRWRVYQLASAGS